jgi:glycosyltransferase involved in cell wall biosynthesis
MSHRVSVIIPAWNMARYLPDAIASVPDVYEIIIVATDSNDNTFGVATELAKHRLGARVLAGSQKSPACARNIGLREASGDIIAFIDADDVWPKGKLALQLERLDCWPQADVVMGLVTEFTEADGECSARADSTPRFVFNVGAAIYRKSVFDRVGLFDESLMYEEDGDLLMRIIEAHVPFVILQTSTLYYRRHADSMMSRDDPRKKSDFARIVAMSLTRRRKLGLPFAPIVFDRYFEEPSK